MKRIAICCDGTWNSPDQKDEEGVASPTNVVKIARAIKFNAADGTKQTIFYDPGVGSSGSFLKRNYEGATGAGISRNIKEAYTYLINHYEPGDELYFFGFSRGAFTVRSLAGLIRNCGLLRKDALDQLDRAYEIYQSSDAADKPSSNISTLFRRTYAVEELTKIKYIGVWDTVGALGNPLLLRGITTERHKFHDYQLSSSILNAFHAVAIDEKRKHFIPALWQQKPSNMGTQILQQVWFTGVHTNVGGGYHATGLSDISLEWMAEKASLCGLELADISLAKDPIQDREESRIKYYKLIPAHHRPINNPSNDPKTGELLITAEALHESVLVRYRDREDFRPPQLVEYFDRNPDELQDEDD
ncbi:MAG: DUF2235 domain-containing protein [Sulfuriflexus sp.]|nr:DUF2235 domain-containing protein [Sulfuriflexus sp.]